jgi:hypothetical protein
VEALDEKVENSSPWKYLLGAQAAVLGVFTALQVTGDLFQQMVANHPYWVGLSILGSIVAFALALIALISKDWGTNRLLLIGIGALVFGMTCATIAATLVASDRGKPVVAITSLSRTQMQVSVKLTNVKTDETIRLRVEPLEGTVNEKGGVSYRSVEGIGPILGAAFGPDSNGVVDRTFTVDLPEGSYPFVGVRAAVGPYDNCFNQHSETTSCSTRRMNRVSERPQLSVDWQSSDPPPVLAVKVSGRNLPSDGSLFLRIQGLDSEDPTILASWSLGPNLEGTVERLLSLSIDPGFREVCVEASSARMPTGSCGGSAEGTAWVRLSLPAT